MDQMFRRKADADGIGADCLNGFRPSENPVSSVLAMSVRHSLPKQITELLEWDPTEPVATRPMFMQYRVPGQTYALFYTHDGNKNVSEVVHFSRANGVAAHYEYAPFGEVTAQIRQGGITAYDFASLNPWRFSSEYADDASATVYYNYRFVVCNYGVWTSRDVDDAQILVYGFVNNSPISDYDVLGETSYKRMNNPYAPRNAPDPNKFSCDAELSFSSGVMPKGVCCVGGEVGVVKMRNGVEFTADGTGGRYKRGERCFSGVLCEYQIVRYCYGNVYSEKQIRTSQVNTIKSLQEIGDEYKQLKF